MVEELWAPKLKQAIEKLHKPAGWVHLFAIGKDGGPHVTPMMMGIHDAGLLFSLTGKQKQRNMERDPRVCVAISTADSMAHISVWGTNGYSSWELLLCLLYGQKSPVYRRS